MTGSCMIPQPTISRFENRVSAKDLRRFSKYFLELHLAYPVALNLFRAYASFAVPYIKR